MIGMHLSDACVSYSIPLARGSHLTYGSHPDGCYVREEILDDGALFEATTFADIERYQVELDWLVDYMKQYFEKHRKKCAQPTGDIGFVDADHADPDEREILERLADLCEEIIIGANSAVGHA